MIRARGLDSWLPTYLKEIRQRRQLRARRKRQLTHVLFLVCDHYEPRHGVKSADQAATRVRTWHESYKTLQDDIGAEFGLRPLHTWFYPPHHGYEHLPALAAMAFDGLGEIELHYHHGNDTEATLRADLQEALARFRRGGLLLQQGDPPTGRFGFIHGDWALDNSGEARYCGVNSELSLLQELGCWGDLTMPSSNVCQTRKINSIYYAIDDRERPKSHDWGEDARAGADGREGLLLIQGPLAVNFGAPRYPRIENASLTSANWGRPDRIRAWIDCHVHVHGRPEWLFVKLHTHGAIEADFDALMGEKARAMHRLLARQLNDGRHFKLHYVTARQAFNVVRAAERGLDGDPGQYFDLEVPRPVTALYCIDAAHSAVCCTPQRLCLRDIELQDRTTLRVRYPGIERIVGSLQHVTLDIARSLLEIHPQPGCERVEIQMARGAGLRNVRGGIVEGDPAGGRFSVSRCAGPVSLDYGMI